MGINPKITTALSKLDHGAWSLTVHGFARRAMGIRRDLTVREANELRDMMDATGLPKRRVKFNETMMDVWDYEVA